MSVDVTQVLGGLGRVVLGSDGWPIHVGTISLTVRVTMPGLVELHDGEALSCMGRGRVDVSGGALTEGKSTVRGRVFTSCDATVVPP